MMNYTETVAYPPVATSSTFFPGATKGMTNSAEPTNLWLSTGQLYQINLQVTTTAVINIYDYMDVDGRTIEGGLPWSVNAAVGSSSVVGDFTELNLKAGVFTPDRKSFSLTISNAAQAEYDV